MFWLTIEKESSKNGFTLIDVATSKDMIISSKNMTSLAKKVHKVTWNSRDGTTKNQLDQILVKR